MTLRCLQSPRRPHRRRGNMVPLVALAIAGGIGALLLINTVSFGNDTSSDAKVDDFYNAIIHIETQMRARYASDFTRFGEFANSGQRLANLKMVNEGRIVGGIATTPWGGVMQANGVSRTRFYLLIRNVALTPAVPLDACVNIINRLSGKPGVASFWGAGSSDIWSPVSHAQAVSLCNEGETWVSFQ